MEVLEQVYYSKASKQKIGYFENKKEVFGGCEVGSIDYRNTELINRRINGGRSFENRTLQKSSCADTKLSTFLLLTQIDSHIFILITIKKL